MLLAFNKPFGVICQFSPSGDKRTLKDFIRQPHVYPIGRLDTDSEGLLLLTDDGALQARIASPDAKLAKTYWAQVEGEPDTASLRRLLMPLDLGDFVSLPAADAMTIPAPAIWPRNPPIRVRATIPTSWIQITLTEGKNRQVRRMTAKIGFPTLRLVRAAIGNLQLLPLALSPGEHREIHASSVLGR